MKILHVAPELFPNAGGVTNVCTNQAKELVNRGHSVTIVCSDYSFSEDLMNELKHAGVPVIPFRSVISLRCFFYTPSFVQWIKDHLSEFDVVHLHDFRSYQNIIICKNARRLGIPVVLQAHGTLLNRPPNSFPKTMFDLTWKERIVNTVDKFIVLTQADREDHLKFGIPADKLVMLPNGINLSEYKNLPEKGRFRKKYSVPDNCFIILYIGRLHTTKGIDFLIQSFMKLVADHPRYKLVLIGPDSGYLESISDEVKRLIDLKDIILTGPKYGEEKIEALVDADVFVLPSTNEVFGISVLEAWACGTPSIITTGCGLSTEPHIAGIVIERNEPALVAAILSITAKEKEISASNGKNIVKDIYNWEKIVMNLEAIYSSFYKGVK
ncbi:glycosyltransferase [uncultured Methanoregula sp.]|uniref:glycosyltransferase n=1 Tax=uncultured Methanoregula sp. TaxID=1005933 RepID=UPI002AABAB5D|nr:glycosyltransferase [uncultured Methanoregula sp.]